jgi:hypothetical protein
MTAKEAAGHVNGHEDESIETVAGFIPAYSNPLPRRAWIKKFRDNLKSPELVTRFTDLQ